MGEAHGGAGGAESVLKVVAAGSAFGALQNAATVEIWGELQGRRVEEKDLERLRGFFRKENCLSFSSKSKRSKL